MAARRPLVLVSGRPQELPTGDTVTGVSGGGGANVGSATIDFGSTPASSASVTVSAPGVTESSYVKVWIMVDETDDVTGGNDIEQHRIAAYSFRFLPNPEPDQIVIEAIAAFGLATGTFNIRYEWQ